MNKILVIIIVSIIFSSCKTEVKPEENLVAEKSSEIKIEEINYDGLELLLNKNNDKTYVINFWATWCKPCVEELPAFQKLHETYKDQNIEVILVSLDFKNQVETRLIPFIKEHNLQPKVVLMVDPDQNAWIPKVSSEWSGAVPATIIYNKNNRKFYERSFTYELLENELINFTKTD